MAHWRQYHESEGSHFSHADLYDEAASDKAGAPRYQKIVVRIERWEFEKLKTRGSNKGQGRNVIYLSHRGKPIARGLGLNATNCDTLTSLSGSPDPKHWVGLTIGLYVDPKARYPKGGTGPGVRIHPTRIGATTDHGALPEVSEETRDRLEEEKQERLEGGGTQAG